MPQMIFVNLPVRDLARSTAFYQAIGAAKDERFCDGTGACMVFSDAIHVMLLTHEKFRQFTPRPIADARAVSQVLICISAASRAAVDDLVGRAGASGGGIDPSPREEFDFMYGRSFEDPDGHLWGVTWLDLEAATAAHSNMAQA
jgi:uncharacterized protein